MAELIQANWKANPDERQSFKDIVLATEKMLTVQKVTDDGAQEIAGQPPELKVHFTAKQQKTVLVPSTPTTSGPVSEPMTKTS